MITGNFYIQNTNYKIEAPVCQHPWEAEKVSVTGAVHLNVLEKISVRGEIKQGFAKAAVHTESFNCMLLSLVINSK